MDYRRLGASGLRVPALSFGTATFGGQGAFFGAWGQTDADGARRLVDLCLAGGITMFDTADNYSQGRSEELLGAALDGRRDDVLISTKATSPVGDGPNERGSSRLHLIAAVEASLRRLRTDHVDLLYMHAFDATTAVEEVVRALDDLVTAGKVRYVGASNFSGWQLMKALSIADRHGWSRHVAHQVQYSLAVRDYERELMPLAVDQGVGGVVWSPLAGAALTGKIRRGRPAPEGSRLANHAAGGLAAEPEVIYTIVDALDEIAGETGRSLSQIALNWLLAQPTISSLVVGARTEEQLQDDLGALGWSLDDDQRERLDRASATPLPYPYRQQRFHPELLAAPWTAPVARRA